MSTVLRLRVTAVFKLLSADRLNVLGVFVIHCLRLPTVGSFAGLPLARLENNSCPMFQLLPLLLHQVFVPSKLEHYQQHISWLY